MDRNFNSLQRCERVIQILKMAFNILGFDIFVKRFKLPPQGYWLYTWVFIVFFCYFKLLLFDATMEDLINILEITATLSLGYQVINRAFELK